MMKEFFCRCYGEEFSANLYEIVVKQLTGYPLLVLQQDQWSFFGTDSRCTGPISNGDSTRNYEEEMVLVIQEMTSLVFLTLFF